MHAYDLGSGSSSSDVDAEARFASLALVGPRNWVVGVARPAREHLDRGQKLSKISKHGALSPVGSGQGGGDLGSALGGRRGARAIPANLKSHLCPISQQGEGSRYLSRAVSMAPGVWGLPLSASVAPRALTSLDTGARGVRQGGRLENELQRRIVQMLKNIYTMYF